MDGNLHFYVWIIENNNQILPNQLTNILKLKKSKDYPSLYKNINLNLKLFNQKNTPTFELFDKERYNNIVKEISEEMIELLKFVDSKLEEIKKVV